MFSNAKAIETKYKGYRFRSRLEARWAVYLDAIGWQWNYEPEGFDLDGIPYLPDFLIEGCNEGFDNHICWLEIKPKKLNELEITKAKLLVAHTKIPVAFGIGLPDPHKLSYGLDSFVRHNVRFEDAYEADFEKIELIENYISLDFYCRHKWGRPGYHMYMEDPCEETIAACNKAKEARFEFNDSK